MLYDSPVQDLPFSELVLTEEEMSCLKQSYDSYAVYSEEKEEIWDALTNYGLVRYADIEGEQELCFEVNSRGKAYMTYLKQQKQASRTANMRYWITTIIAALALVLSLLSLWLQVRPRPSDPPAEQLPAPTWIATEGQAIASTESLGAISEATSESDQKEERLKQLPEPEQTPPAATD